MTPPPLVPVTRISEFTGDKVTDLVVRDRASQLCPYPGNGTGGFATRTPAGTGWRGMTALVTPGKWDRAGRNDLIARDGAGTLWLYHCRRGLPRRDSIRSRRDS